MTAWHLHTMIGPTPPGGKHYNCSPLPGWPLCQKWLRLLPPLTTAQHDNPESCWTLWCSTSSCPSLPSSCYSNPTLRGIDHISASCQSFSDCEDQPGILFLTDEGLSDPGISVPWRWAFFFFFSHVAIHLMVLPRLFSFPESLSSVFYFFSWPQGPCKPLPHRPSLMSGSNSSISEETDVAFYL